MKNLKQNKPTKEKEIKVPNKVLVQIMESSYYQNSMQKIENSDVNINHLENIFTNKTYYLAMKIVPLIERKVLYLSYIENVRLSDICKRLKLSKKQVITLRNRGINHFKNNLVTLAKAEKLRNGSKKVWTATTKEKLRVLYKRVGQVPEIKIINNAFKLEKAVVYKKLAIIPYQNVFIICHHKKVRKNMPINVVFDMFHISGDFIVVQIDKNKRKFESISQENASWFTEDLIYRSFNTKIPEVLANFAINTGKKGNK